MTCHFQSPRDQTGFACSINRYGGRPHALACQQCIAAGENTEEFGLLLLAQLSAPRPPEFYQQGDDITSGGCRSCGSSK
jgi:hypothetical protein